MGDEASDRLCVIELPSGGRLEVRIMSAADVDLLDELYRSLSATDLRRRFFTATHPSRRVVEDWAAIGDRGGFGLIAVEYRESVRPVAEAGYAVLDDGFGELAVTVAPDWRGWLGPYLIELLVEHAAACGIPGLKAEVLADNTIMRRVLGHRGAVVTERGAGTMQLMIGTTTRVAPWLGTDERPRALIEVAGGHWAPGPAASAAGLTTRVCPGPGATLAPSCPLLEGGSCPLASQADVIVMLLPRDDERTGPILEHHRTTRPGIPILVIEDADGSVPSGCVPLTETMGPTEVVGEILSLIGRSSRAVDRT